MNEKTETLLNYVREYLVKILEEIPVRDDYKLHVCSGSQTEVPCIAMYISIGADPYKNAEKYIEFNELMAEVIVGWKSDLLHYGEYVLCECGKDRNPHEPKLKDDTLFCGYCGKKLIWDGGEENGI